MAGFVAPASPLPPERGHATAGRYWWVPLAAGVLSLVVGVLALVYPGPTLLAVGLIFGGYLVFWGVMTLMRGMSEHSLLLGIFGLLTVFAGLLLLVRPEQSVALAAWVLGFWWVLAGVMELTTGIVVPGNRGAHIALGALGVVAGAIILAQPQIGLVTLVWIAGVALLVQGALEVAAGLQIRKLHKAGTL